MKKIFLYSLLGILFSGCTKDFEQLNKNTYGATQEELDRVPYGGNQLLDLQRLIIPDQENAYQMSFDLFSPIYAGYGSSFNNFQADYATYSPRSNWTDYPFSDTYPKIYKAFNDLRSASKGDFNKTYFALGSIYRVAITHWLTDTYGGLPYSQVKSGQLQVPYDTQRDLYLNLCEDLVSGIEGLKRNLDNTDYASFDYIYGGDIRKWIKYANSLLLRISVRMSKADPVNAKRYAEMAIQEGVILTNEENAILATKDNPLFKITHTWENSCVGADITEYMNAFNDPRREKFFTKVKSRTAGKQFFGRRNGAPNLNFIFTDYSLPNIKQDSGIVLISASEVAFLKAEGALLGWNVGDTAENLYTQGVRLSFEQWGAGDPTAYLASTNIRGNFSDEKESAYDVNFSSNISVSWAEAGGDTQKQLSKIITQKWIALYPYGSQEAWAEWRRTGFPNLMPVLENRSNGVISHITQSNSRDTGGMRRIPYSTKEYQGQSRTSVLQAVNNLGGADNGSTNMWWAR